MRSSRHDLPSVDRSAFVTASKSTNWRERGKCKGRGMCNEWSMCHNGVLVGDTRFWSSNDRIPAHFSHKYKHHMRHSIISYLCYPAAASRHRPGCRVAARSPARIGEVRAEMGEYERIFNARTSRATFRPVVECSLNHLRARVKQAVGDQRGVRRLAVRPRQE